MITAQGMPYLAAIAVAVRERHPFALCYVCLGSSLGLSEPEVREAAQTLMDGSFTTELRACASCMKADTLIVPKAEARAELRAPMPAEH